MPTEMQARERQADPPPAADHWTALDGLFDRFRAAGRAATFWWRDDDAARPDPALDRLLALADGRPIALAAIPAALEPALARDLADGPRELALLPHGFRHRNNAPPGEKKAEFGPHRPVDAMLAEIAQGWARLRDLAGPRAAAIFTPPWNRIAPALAARLPEAGMAGLSTVKPRAPGDAGRRINCHLDLIDWKGGRRFVGETAALAALIRHLTDRLEGAPGVDPTEPTGLLTHHLDHDAGCWDFLARLLAAIDAHPAARLVGPVEALGAPAPAPSEAGA